MIFKKFLFILIKKLVSITVFLFELCFVIIVFRKVIIIKRFFLTEITTGKVVVRVNV